MVRHKHRPGARSFALQQHKKRMRRYQDRDAALYPEGLVARPTVPKSKHKTILEWTDNIDKKKKLEIEVTTNKNPNANFTFVPVGNPELSSLCKELSREQGALVYIVSTTKEKGTIISDHVHRVGYHFRTLIVEQAASMVEGRDSVEPGVGDIARTDSQSRPNHIPETQEDINKQADAAIRDLFPRIPNTDREMIVRHAFQKGAVFNGNPVVGLQADLSLSRRVQLAVTAHIRHTHTRYDLLLRETSWENARRTVESLCLDILVKWRGDEETGRDQLDEVLREIVIIDDSEDEDDDDDSEEGSESEEDDISDEVTSPTVESSGTTLLPLRTQAESGGNEPAKAQDNTVQKEGHRVGASRLGTGVASRTRSRTKPSQRQRAKKGRRGNRRYQAWQEALNRSHERPSAPKTPLEQTFRRDMRETNGTPRLMRQGTPIGTGTSNFYSAPSGNDYQTIYAMDDVHRPDRRKRLSATHRMTTVSEIRHREQVLKSPQSFNYANAEYSFASDPPSALRRAIPNYDPVPQQNFAASTRELAPRDMALPSIEPPTDLTSENSARTNSNGPSRHPQVMYTDVEPGRRIVQIQPSSTHGTGWEDSQPKRRRVIAANDPADLPTRLSNIDSYGRLEPNPVAERPLLLSSSMRSVSDVRNGRYLHDMPSVSDSRLENFRPSQRVSSNRGRDGIPSVTDSRDYYGSDRERRVIIIDDSPPLVRLVRRAPLPGQTYYGDQHDYESRVYSSQRAGQPEKIDTLRPSKPRPTLLEEASRPLHPNQAAEPTFYTRISASNQQSMADDRSTSFPTFPSHSHSREMNTGLVSYPVLSRVRPEPVTRVLSTRNEPKLAGTKSSHHVSQERLPENLETIPLNGRETFYRPVNSQQVTRMEQRYAPIDPQGRPRHIETQYIAVDSRDRMQGVTRGMPINASGLKDSNGPRQVSHREEIIVLSP